MRGGELAQGRPSQASCETDSWVDAAPAVLGARGPHASSPCCSKASPPRSPHTLPASAVASVHRATGVRLPRPHPAERPHVRATRSHSPRWQARPAGAGTVGWRPPVVVALVSSR